MVHGVRSMVRWTAVTVVGAVCVACGRGRDGRPGQPSTSIPVAASSPAPAPCSTPPLQSTPPIVPLPVPGFPEAVVSVPLGATSRRPVVVATHGLWDFPEGLCDNWRWIVGDRAWVLCPRGDAMPDQTFRYRSGPALAKEIEAGLSALARRYPRYVDDGPGLYTGFSLGAILRADLIGHHPAPFPRPGLTEGGADQLSPSRVPPFAHRGAYRVPLSCA